MTDSTQLRAKLKSGKVVLGSWITFADTAVAEILARSGFEWLTVDMEHSPLTLSQAQELIRVISLCGVCPFVRLPSNDPVLAKRVMDAGACGTIVPMVNTREQAERAVRSIKYPPEGERGVGLARAQGYGPQFEEYVTKANSESLVFLQIEHEEAVANIEAILSVPGVDGFIVGPYDMTASMGVPGKFDDPRFVDAIQRIRDVAHELDIASGIHVVYPLPDQVIERMAQGFQLIAYGVDFLFLGEMSRRGVQEINQRLTD